MPAAATCQQPATAPAARAYRPRRPAATLLHELVRTNLETWLATAAECDEYGRGVPLHVEAALRNYLRCGILAHGFARVYCGNCRHDYLVAFSCKGRDLCPSCATRRMVGVSSHMVEQVLPRVQHRQWVLSVPKRVRWHLRTKPEVISGLLAIFLRAVEITLRQRSPGAPAGARFGAVAFVHRFGSYLNSHVHFHVLVTDGVFSAGDDGEAIFHPALDLEPGDFAAVQAKMRHRGLRWLHRHGHLDDDALHVLDSAEHAGGWSVDASVTVPGWDRQGLERLVRYCARPPLSQERLGRLNEQTLVYSLRRPTADGRTELLLTPTELLDLLAQLVTPPRLHKHRYCGVLAPNAALREAVTASAGPAGATLQLLEQARASMGLPAVEPDESAPSSPLSKLRRAAARCWALLLVRIYECLPLTCPKCGEPMRIIAFVLDQPTIERILDHVGVIGRRAWMPTEPERLPPVGRRPTADPAAGGAAGAVAAAAGVRVRPDARDRRLAGGGPDGGAGSGRLGVIPLAGERTRAAAKAGRRMGACVCEAAESAQCRAKIGVWVGDRGRPIDFRGSGAGYSGGVGGLSRGIGEGGWWFGFPILYISQFDIDGDASIYVLINASDKKNIVKYEQNGGVYQRDTGWGTAGVVTIADCYEIKDIAVSDGDWLCAFHSPTAYGEGTINIYDPDGVLAEQRNAFSSGLPFESIMSFECLTDGRFVLAPLGEDMVVTQLLPSPVSAVGDNPSPSESSARGGAVLRLPFGAWQGGVSPIFCNLSWDVAHLQVDVYDLRGAHVRTIWSGARPGGMQELSWDNRNSAYRRMPSGVYLVKMEADGLVETGKIILLK